jgi:hypothetical protein
MISDGKISIAKNGFACCGKGNVRVADVPMMNGECFEFRQLWVNNGKQ